MARALLGALAVAVALAPPADAGPLRFSVALARGARLGGSAAVRLSLHVDLARLRAPVTNLQVLLPRGIDLGTSDLGLATCRIPPSDFQTVLFSGPPLECPPNSVLGTGSVAAAIWLDADDRIAASGGITLVSAPALDGRPGITALVVAQNPVRAQLAYAGGLFPGPRGYGTGVGIALPAIPHPPLDAAVGLTNVRLEIGGPALRYAGWMHGRRVSYRPNGLTLPARCPRRGLPFRVNLAFADGGRSAAGARARCPLERNRPVPERSRQR